MLAKIGVRDGSVVAMRVLPDDGDFLGDSLRRMGAWDEKVHGVPEPGEPVGQWAARVGATSASAVSLALRKQLQRRMARLLGVDPPELRLTPGAWEVGVPALDEPPKTAELIVSALRDRAEEVPLLWARRRVGENVLVLTPLGKELLTDAVLWPEEAALVQLLETGAPTDVLLSSTGGSARSLRLLYALRQVGACAPPEPRKGYATLLRKTRQVRQAARAAELLELPTGAPPQEARKALRKLAAAIHPDRFGTTAPAAIRSASHQVMSALVRAQNDLR
ncbi:MAG: J domain-containing protein [Sandaracinaceae bacterium]